MGIRGPVAIVGAGWLGAALARALPCPVLATTRRGTLAEPVPAHVKVTALDLTAEDLDASALAPARQLVFAAAPGMGGRTGAEAERRRHAVYVAGTARLLLALARAGTVPRLIFVGSTSALPQRDGWLDEACATMPQSSRGKTQRAAERTVLAAGNGLIVRMGGLVGPGRTLSRIYRTQDEEIATPRPGDGMAATNLIHRDDAVAALLAALDQPHVRGIVHAVADSHPPRRALYAAVAAATGQPAPQWAEPARSAIPHGKRVSNLRLKLALGVRLRYPELGVAGPKVEVGPCVGASGD